MTLKTSLGIWALGPMITRFVPVGYQPQWTSENVVDKVGRAVAGLGDLIDDYEFHYPQEINEGRVHANFIIWPGIEGYNYPFQSPYRESWAWLIEGIGTAAQRCKEHGIKLFLEHKNSEPAMKILMRNIGMTLHVIHKLRAQGLDNVKVNMDWQHLLMNGENLGEYAAMLAGEGLLGHQHANSGWGTFDDDNMVGATAFMETLELALELRRAGYGDNGERLGFDLYPYTEDAIAAVRRSVLQWRFIDSVAARIDDAALHEAQSRKDAVRAYEIVYKALGAE